MTEPLTDLIRRLDRDYTWSYYLGAGDPGDVRYHEGVKVLYIAPHAVRQLRTASRGRKRVLYKPADRYTGAIAEALAQKSGAGALTMIGAEGDAAQDDPHPLKAALDEALSTGRYELVLDLHGMTNAHGRDVAFGLGSFPTPRTINRVADLAEAADDAGLYWAVNPDGLRASELTVTSYAQRSEFDVTAVQIELAADIRSPQHPDRLSRTLTLLGSVTEVRV